MTYSSCGNFRQHQCQSPLHLLFATAGGTVVNVLDDIIARGADASQIVVVCIVAAPPALKKLSEKYLGECPTGGPLPNTCKAHCMQHVSALA